MGEKGVIRDRILWVDYAKAIGIATVVLVHTVDYVLAYPVMSWICSFCVQFFFVMSGYMTNEKDSVWTTTKKGFKGIIIPYFSFHLLILLFFVATQTILDPYFYNGFSTKIREFLLGILLGEGQDTPYSNNLNTPLWFLPSLFFCKIVLQLALKLGEKYRSLFLLLLTIGSVGITYYLSNKNINIYFCIDSAIMGLPFYILGFVLKDILKFKEQIKNSRKQFLFGLSFLVLNILTSYLDQSFTDRIDMNMLGYGHSLLLFYITGAAGALSIFYFARSLSGVDSKLLSYIGQNTLIILGIHYTLIKYMKMGWGYFLDTFVQVGFNPILMYVGDISIAILVTLLCIPPIYIIRKYFPFMIGKFSI